jgi:hypothetical protein
MGVAKFTSRPPYPMEKIPSNPLDSRLDGRHSRFRAWCRRENSIALVGNRTPAIKPTARRYTEWATSTQTMFYKKAYKFWVKAKYFSFTFISLNVYMRMYVNWTHVHRQNIIVLGFCSENNVPRNESDFVIRCKGREFPTGLDLKFRSLGLVF